MSELTLYGRAYCHLCEDMKIALEPLRRDFSFVLHEVDVDADPAAETRFGELVPVLAAGGPGGCGETLCHYFLDEKRVRVWLGAHAGQQGTE
ncbi:glutaredoxin family protein [Cupriavidus basilensis]|uniref:Glutaredoxin family protein n=1 Tax=Cupriavidus basilensis TaxID=68895 RepID=A0ABT6ART0_9BURK|nr:glutaredoxin family protein [Cupriavidus basilensis]MDF3835307.1 glutaredoxin family protein [Cupriavidus basilensis]